MQVVQVFYNIELQERTAGCTYFHAAFRFIIFGEYAPSYADFRIDTNNPSEGQIETGASLAIENEIRRDSFGLGHDAVFRFTRTYNQTYGPSKIADHRIPGARFEAQCHRCNWTSHLENTADAEALLRSHIAEAHLTEPTEWHPSKHTGL